MKPRRFYHTGFEHSLENILSKEEPEKERGVLDKVFSDKNKTLKATIKALFNEVMLRENLDSFLLYQINEDICRQHNHLEQVGQLMRFNYSTGFLDYFSKAKIRLENNVLELEKQKRQEYLECWKDLMGLKKELLSGLKDYWNLNSRKSFLNMENGYGESLQETEAYNWKQS
ncbi:MAG: hypothetical protein JSW18_03510 [Candidatus Omnitrophota bacterium]|nr:MAG: hypothetical protein JSW18_03510 [Candidatus Omnitrophota bacterium]